MSQQSGSGGQQSINYLDQNQPWLGGTSAPNSSGPSASSMFSGLGSFASGIQGGQAPSIPSLPGNSIPFSNMSMGGNVSPLSMMAMMGLNQSTSNPLIQQYLSAFGGGG